MNKTIIIVSMALMILSFMTFSNIAVIQGVTQENTNLIEFLRQFNTVDVNNEEIVVNKITVTEKIVQDTVVLGWEIEDQQSGINVPGFTITGVCVGIYENTVVLVESTLLSEYPVSRGNSIAEDFQTKIYTPTA